MKKIFMASFVAMMAVTAANADIASTKYVTDRTGDTSKITQGLGSDLTTAINAVNEKIGAGEITINDGQIVTDMINNGAVTTGKIADSAVTTVKILDKNVTTEKIADSAVTTVKILDKNVTTEKIADLAVTTGKIADNAVTSAKIANGEVKTDDIAALAVTTAKIADKNVTAAKLADGVAVANIGYTPENIANKVDSITEADKENTTKYTTVKAVYDHVGALKTELSQSASQDETRFSQIESDISSLSDEKVDVDQGKDNASKAVVTDAAGKITTSQIAEGMIADNAVTSGKIANGEVKTDDIAASAVTTVKILDKNVTTEKLADGAVTSAKILDGEVKTADIADKNVTKAKLAQAVQDSLDLADSAMQEAALKTLASWKTSTYDCGAAGTTCSLVSKGGAISWEKVEY